LSAAELQRAGIATRELFTRGSWPELHVRPELDPVRYLDDHVRTFIEKDIAATAGVVKLREFRTFLGLLAARSGQLLNASEIGQHVGIKGSTVQEWISLLAENGHSNRCCSSRSMVNGGSCPAVGSRCRSRSWPMN
jgi:predicted AAA+ superfamily ATPase